MQREHASRVLSLAFRCTVCFPSTGRSADLFRHKRSGLCLLLVLHRQSRCCDFVVDVYTDRSEKSINQMTQLGEDANCSGGWTSSFTYISFNTAEDGELIKWTLPPHHPINASDNYKHRKTPAGLMTPPHINKGTKNQFSQKTGLMDGRSLWCSTNRNIITIHISGNPRRVKFTDHSGRQTEERQTSHRRMRR